MTGSCGFPPPSRHRQAVAIAEAVSEGSEARCRREPPGGVPCAHKALDGGNIQAGQEGNATVVDSLDGGGTTFHVLQGGLSKIRRAQLAAAGPVCGNSGCSGSAHIDSISLIELMGRVNHDFQVSIPGEEE
jgi:hypothetical protein